MKILSSILCAMVAPISLVYPQTGVSESAVAAAMRADQARVEAMLAHDLKTLDALGSDQLRYVHAGGLMHSKAQWLKNYETTKFTTVTTSDVQTTQVAPDVVAVFGVQDMKGWAGTEWKEAKLNYLGVWRNEKGTWRLIAWNCQRIAAPVSTKQ